MAECLTAQAAAELWGRADADDACSRGLCVAHGDAPSIRAMRPGVAAGAAFERGFLHALQG